MPKKIRLAAGALALVSTVAGCAAVPPAGPALMGLPGQGKTFDAFRQDDTACRAHAASHVPPNDTTYGMQRAYDIAYTQCMVSRGDRVMPPPAAPAPAYAGYPAYPAYGDYDDFYGPDYEGGVYGFGFGWGGWGGGPWHGGGWGGGWHGDGGPGGFGHGGGPPGGGFGGGPGGGGGFAGGHR